MTEKEAKVGLDSRAGGRGIVINSIAVGRPNDVKCHCMSCLQTIPVLPAKESRAARRPREQCLSKRHWGRKLKYGLKFGPDCTSKGAGIEKMGKGLGGRTVMTEKRFRSEMEDAMTKRKRVEKHLVPGFAMAREKRTTPKSTPDILWRKSDA